jgi:tRNA(fMet)-specific endonuclease VapC
MSSLHLLDTNTASCILKGNPPRVREHLLRTPMGEIAISVVTEAELRFGVERGPDLPKLRIAVEEFLLRLQILPWDSEAARNYARMRADLEKRGTPMGNLDMMIAAQALTSGAKLVSGDRVFRRVNGLKVEDWTT